MARNYFSHDSNAQNDEKIINMRMDHGPAGYGVYWMIVERLRDADGYRLTANYKALAFAMMCDEALVRSVVEDYGLFVVEGGKLHSESLMRRMDKMDERSRKARRRMKRPILTTMRTQNILLMPKMRMQCERIASVMRTQCY
jgi:hypothetical protein